MPSIFFETKFWNKQHEGIVYRNVILMDFCKRMPKVPWSFEMKLWNKQLTVTTSSPFTGEASLTEVERLKGDPVVSKPGRCNGSSQSGEELAVDLLGSIGNHWGSFWRVSNWHILEFHWNQFAFSCWDLLEKFWVSVEILSKVCQNFSNRMCFFCFFSQLQGHFSWDPFCEKSKD